MRDHLQDLDADFLEYYGIDLEEANLPAPRFLSLAWRILDRDGSTVKAIRAAEESKKSRTVRKHEAAGHKVNVTDDISAFAPM